MHWVRNSYRLCIITFVELCFIMEGTLYLSVVCEQPVAQLDSLHLARKPPSTGKATPVTQAALSLARNKAPWATSRASPQVPQGVCAMRASLTSLSSTLAFVIAVRVTTYMENQPLSSVVTQPLAPRRVTAYIQGIVRYNECDVVHSRWLPALLSWWPQPWMRSIRLHIVLVQSIPNCLHLFLPQSIFTWKKWGVLQAPSRKPTTPKMLEVFTIQPLCPLGPRSCLRNCAQANLQPRYTLRRFTVLKRTSWVTRQKDVLHRPGIAKVRGRLS